MSVSHRTIFASWFLKTAIALSLAVAAPSLCLAGPREQAKRVHDRLVGVPPSASTLDSMAASIEAGDPINAAYEAMQDSEFYRSSLRVFVTPWTNVEQSVLEELNDYTATVIGMIRDDVPFNEVLSTDLVYVGAPGVVPSPYSHTDNDHYRQLEDDRIDLGDPSRFIPVAQSSLLGSPLTSADTAGVISTRAAAQAFFSAGTNRRMWRFTAINYLCRDMEDLKDITRPVDRIRQDVSRSPGGDSSIFQNHCTGCHSGMDPMAQAYAYFEFDQESGRLEHTPGQVQPKYLINANTFPFGYATTENRWDNFWRNGPNASLDWRGAEPGGYGAKSLGLEVTASRAFSVCQTEKVFERVCFHPAASAEERAEIERIADVFETQAYSMKRVFAEAAAFCMGD